MSELRLYSRPDCHLCEVAADLIHQSGVEQGLKHVNIEDDLALLRRYGIRIPVLQRMDTGAELFWPFNQEGLLAFLQTEDS